MHVLYVYMYMFCGAYVKVAKEERLSTAFLACDCAIMQLCGVVSRPGFVSAGNNAY